MNSFVAKDTAFRRNHHFSCRGRELIKTGPLVMGIINITPDSFYAGSRAADEEALISKAARMLEQGADILDLGAVSTRPGAAEIGPEEEINRLIPALHLLVKHFPGAFFSVDTWRADIAAMAVDSGALMVNDISGGSFDPGMIDFIASHNIPYVMMHTTGRPSVMQRDPLGADKVVQAVRQFFEKQIELLRQKGATQIVTDPGFGFGKTLEANYVLLKHLPELRVGNFPQLVGISRKSMIYRSLQTTPEEALNGTSVLNTVALLNGADILRVHDVKEAREAVMLVEQLFQTDKR